MDWISVKDRLPTLGEEVFVYGIREHDIDPDIFKSTLYKVDVYESDKHIETDLQYWESDTAYEIEVTHWAFKPEPPKS